MDIVMGAGGARFMQFIKAKLRERKAVVDGFNDADYAKEISVEYGTLKRWLKQKRVERLDLENFLAVHRVYGQEFIDFLEKG